jgi:hypothetical protein
MARRATAVKRKTINQRAGEVLKRRHNLPAEMFEEGDDLREGWFVAGFREGWEAQKRFASKTPVKP